MKKTCLITGATSGIGKAAILSLARKDYRLLFIGRDQERVKQTLSEIEDLNGEAEYFLCDLSSRKDILATTEKIKSRLDRLDILINNAGAIFMKPEMSVDGIEMTFALNHFGYFWLTMELLELIRESERARIINVSSNAHKRVFSRNLDGFFDSFDFFGYFNYGKSKLANLWFTFELARRLKNSAITVNTMHPGLVATRFAANNGVMGVPFKILTDSFGLTADEGASTIIYLADSQEVNGITGKYFVREKVANPSSLSLDEELAGRFFAISEEMTAALD